MYRSPSAERLWWSWAQTGLGLKPQSITKIHTTGFTLKDPSFPRAERNKLLAPSAIGTLLAEALLLEWRSRTYLFFLMILSACTNYFIWPQHNALFFFFPFPPSLHLHARMCNNTENWFLPLYYLWITCIPSLLANKEIGNLSSFASGYPYDTLFLYLL